MQLRIMNKHMSIKLLGMRLSKNASVYKTIKSATQEAISQKMYFIHRIAILRQTVLIPMYYYQIEIFRFHSQTCIGLIIIFN